MKSEPPFTILLVEDHDDSREAIKNWLEWKGWHVFAVPDQESALAIGQKNAVDLLICDLQLPDGNGWELMKRLKTIKPIVGIMTSGHCAPADIARSKAAGFIKHLIKPYPVEELETLLDRAQRQFAKSPAGLPAAPAQPDSRTSQTP